MLGSDLGDRQAQNAGEQHNREEEVMKKEPPAIPSLPAARKVLSFSPKQRTLVT
jgi:hypothetical protein